MDIIAGRLAIIQTEIRQVEQQKLQCEQMLGLFWEHPPALDPKRNPIREVGQCSDLGCHNKQPISSGQLPILNPNELDLCKMMIEQYFLMTNYSLWEVILNGDSPAPTRVIEGVIQHVAPTTDEQRLARKNELKACGTLLMALPDKHQLKFNIQKDAKTLMEAIEKRFGRNKETKKVHKTPLKQQYENFTGSSSESLDQIHDRLQKLISQLEILGESLSQEDINLKFLRSLPTEWRTHTLIWRNKTDLEEQSLDDLFYSLKIYEAEVKSSSSAISAAASVFDVSAKIPVSALPNIDADDVEEMDLKWQMAMLTVRARKFLQRAGRNLGANGPTSMGFDMSKVECYSYHRKGQFARECRSPKDTRRNGAAKPQRRNVSVETSTSNALVSQCDGVGNYNWSFQAEEEPTYYALMAFTSSSSSSSDNELRDNALVVLRQNLEKTEQERDDLKLKLEKFQTSSKNLSQLLASQTNDKTELGYNTQVFTRSMFDCHEYFTFESDDTLPPSPIYDRYQSGDGYHDVPPPYTGTFMPPKPDLVFHNAPNHVETFILAANPKTALPKPKSHGNIRNRKACFVCKSLTHLIKDCDYPAKKMAQTPARNHAPRGHHQQYATMTLPNPQRHVAPPAVLTKSKLVPITAVRPVNAVVLKPHVTRPKQAKNDITKPNSPPRRHINRSPSPKASNFPPTITVAKALMHDLKDKGVIDSGCSRHMTRNMSYLSNFEELNGGYVTFGGNLKGGKISGKDANQVLLRVLRENNMYNVDLMNLVPYGDLTCLFAKETFDESEGYEISTNTQEIDGESTENQEEK
nr:hypothetical protein [Tanacetum cinerariifolium]